MTQTIKHPLHPFHILPSSPWPFFIALSLLIITISAVFYMHRYTYSGYFLILGFISLLFILFFWWRDMIIEANSGFHTFKVQYGLRLGMLLFILSEVFFFVAFFWAFFNSSIIPNIQIGHIWPPIGIQSLDPWDIPFINTLILLLSGITITWAHYAMINGYRKDTILGLSFTIILGLIFIFMQYLEYIEASFNISDGIFGSVFFMATGFHGFHVLIGIIFISICLIREIFYQFSQESHLALEAAAWYWHFVDVVWMILFLSVYVWGN